MAESCSPYSMFFGLQCSIRAMPQPLPSCVVPIVAHPIKFRHFIGRGSSSNVSVRFLPSQDAIGGASFSGRVDLVGEDVFGERFANRQIETCEQLGEGFAFSAFQHS